MAGHGTYGDSGTARHAHTTVHKDFTAFNAGAVDPVADGHKLGAQAVDSVVANAL